MSGGGRGQDPHRGKSDILSAAQSGFYSKTFTHPECNDLEAMLAEGLSDEIALMRVAIRRVAELANETGEDSEQQSSAQALEQAVDVLRALGLASIRLGSLLKIQNTIVGDENSTARAINQALTELTEELGLK